MKRSYGKLHIKEKKYNLPEKEEVCMKRGYLLGMWLIGVICIHVEAQSDLTFTMDKEGKILIIPREKHYELNLPKFSYKSYTPASTRLIESKLQEFMPGQPLRADERPMDMQIASAAYRPYFNVFTPMLRQVSPMALDFNETSVIPLNDHFSFVVNGRQYTWPGAGGLTEITPELMWQNERWMLSVGGFAGKFYTPFNPSPALTGGAHVQARYAVTEWMALRGWGQYAAYGDEEKNPHMLLNPFYNHTSVGGALEFNFTENFGVGFGVNYEYNPIRRKMEPQYLVYPIFRSKNIRIGW